MERGISIKNQLLTRRMETRVQAYKGDFLVQAKHQVRISLPSEMKGQDSTNDMIQS